MEPGNLEVVVFKGKGLSGKKIDELPSTSLEIKLGKEVVGSRLVENNSNPQWNTIHQFEKVDLSNEKLKLEISIRDKKDKFAGRVQISLAQSLPEDKRYRCEKWLPVLGKKLEDDPNIAGEIQVKLRFITAQELRDKEHAKEIAKDKALADQTNDRNKLMEGRKPASMTKPKASPFGDDNSAAGPMDKFVEDQIQSVVEQTEKVRMDSKATTQRTLQSLGQAQEIAAVSAEKLSHQGEQLNRIVGDSYKIEDDMKISARQIRGIKSIFGAAANFFSKSPGPTKRRQPKDSKDKEDKDSKDSKGSKKDKKSTDQNPFSQTDGAQSVGQDQSYKHQDDDVDRDLEQISFGINNLKNIATEMGREIDSQSKTIDTLIDQTEKNQGIIHKYDTKIRR